MQDFQLGVQRDFVAQHFLIGGDWGAENERHSHHYRLELVLTNDELDEHRYLVDIVRVKQCLDEQIARYRDRTLNELDAFQGVNPSLEEFARVLARELAHELADQPVSALKVKLWEDEDCWASYRIDLGKA